MKPTKETEFQNLKQGDTISSELFEYIKTEYILETDEYETALINIMSKDNEEIMQVTPGANGTYTVYYIS